MGSPGVTDHVLTGCRSTPLLSYLKALGVARLVHRVDPAVRLWWGREGFAKLRTRFDRAELVAYFLDEYEPSPIASPWNGGSGFYPGDNLVAVEKVERSKHPRLQPLRQAVDLGRTMVAERCPTAAPKDKPKYAFIEAWRATCSEDALAWLDATWALTDDSPSANPLLGTGGNDGRLEFARNFAERITTCLPQLWDPIADLSPSRALLEWALFAHTEVRLDDGSIGMFAPGSNGLPNSSSSSTMNSLSSPWEFVLMMEGALLFGASVSRRLSSTVAAFPFTVRRPAFVGVGTGPGDANKTRGEVWLPLWYAPASVVAIRRTLSEGRAQDGARQSQSGRDMARSVAALGTERGIAAFERILLVERNGLAYAAVPVDRIEVRAIPNVELLRSADSWLMRARSIDSSAVQTAVTTVDRTAYAIASGLAGASVAEWLLGLADAQIAVGGRAGVRDRSARSHVVPLGGLPKDLVFALDSSPEVRLARSIAALGRGAGQSGLRSLIEPVEVRSGGWFQWSQNVRGASAAGLRHPLTTMARLAQIDATNDEPGRGGASLRDALAFLSGGVDEQRLIELAFALTLCVPALLPQDGSVMSASGVDRLYAVCRVATVPTVGEGGDSARPPARDVIPALAGGQPERALRAAMRHLRSAGRVPLKSLVDVTATRAHAQRVAAALAIPIRSADLERLGRVVFAPPTENEGTTP